MALFTGIRAILIDADDTLFSVTPSVGAIYQEELQLHGVSVAEDKVAQALHSAWREIKPFYENRTNGYVTFEVRERELWREFSRRVLFKLDVEDFSDTVLDAIYERFSKGASRKLRKDAVEFLEWIKNSSMNCGVFTNNDRRINQLLEDLGIRGFFNHVVSSDILGHKKPSIEAFRGVERLFNLPPKDMLLIGNSPEHDIVGAQNASWNAVLLRNASKPFPSQSKMDKNVAQVSSFLEIISLIDPKL